jgi:hypothetical protein
MHQTFAYIFFQTLHRDIVADFLTRVYPWLSPLLPTIFNRAAILN